MNPDTQPTGKDLAFAFAPDGKRASRLDHAIRSDLAESLEHLCARCQDIISFDSDAVQRLIEGLKAGERYPPAAFGIYSHLVFALLQNDHAGAAALFAQLTHLPAQTEHTEILFLDDPRLTPHHQQMLPLMGFRADDCAAMGPADPEALARFLQDHRWAMERLAADLPELSAEIHAMVSQLILIWLPDSPERLSFDGGSAPMLWGGMFIHAGRHRTPLELLEVLVHESAHLLLYAFTQHEPLVLNDEAERYDSPLRNDPRPMEGIFHATWVSARMAYAMHTLASSRYLDAALRDQARAATQVDLANFTAGLAQVQAHARLSDTGRRVIEAAATAMGAIGLSHPAAP